MMVTLKMCIGFLTVVILHCGRCQSRLFFLTGSSSFEFPTGVMSYTTRLSRKFTAEPPTGLEFGVPGPVTNPQQGELDTQKAT